MAKAEIDSFILKFKNLLLSGRNATLVLKSNAGNAEVSLNVDLGQVPPQPTQHVHHQSRDGPSRQRRRLRRAQARATEAEEVTEVSDAQVETAAQAKDSETDLVQTEPETLKDEFCSDKTFEKQALIAEDAIEEALVEKILVTADCQADWNDVYVTKFMDEKLKLLRIQMKSIVVNRNVRKSFESCLVTIETNERRVIESKSFPIRRWTMKCIP
jgi:hypothetical protein